MEAKTIQSLAVELSAALDTRTRANGTEFTCLADGAPQWMTDVIRAIHDDKLPDDTTYGLIKRCADALAELDVDASESDASDAIAELESDVYTNDLTAWLNARADHLYYLGQAMEDFSPTDGFALLSMAQKIQIDEVGCALVYQLSKLAEVSE